MNLGDDFPNFTVDTTEGRITFHDFLGDHWGVLFSHPGDYTPVCTTELAEVANLIPEFTRRDVKVIALSCDYVTTHKGWIADIKSYACYMRNEWPYPLIADPNRDIAIQLGMLDPVAKDRCGIPVTCRAVFIIGPDKKLKLALLYPATTGRNFAEILRVIDSLQLTACKRVATPANWQPGEKCMILPSIGEEEAVKLFPKGIERIEMPSGKHYMRYTPHPE